MELDKLISNKQTLNFTNSTIEVVQRFIQFISTSDIFIKISYENGKPIYSEPMIMINNEEDRIVNEYGLWVIWNAFIGGLDENMTFTGSIDYHPKNGYNAFSRSYKNSIDFCRRNIMEIELSYIFEEDENIIHPTTIMNMIHFILFFYSYRRTDSKIFLRVCDEKTLVLNHPEVAKRIFETYSYDYLLEKYKKEE